MPRSDESTANLLEALGRGESRALDELMPRLYAELHRTEPRPLSGVALDDRTGRRDIPPSASDPYDPRATELVLLGRSHGNRRSVEELALARQYFQRALDIDPADARAYAGLADTYISVAQWGFTTPDDSYPIARQLTATALRLDTLSAEAHASLAAIAHNYDWNWEEAVRLARRAIALDPEHVGSYRPLTQSLSILGRETEAVDAARRADALERLPDDQGMRSVFQSYLRRDFDAAVEHARAVLEFNPRIWQARLLMGLSLVGAGRGEPGVGECEAAVSDSDRSSVALGALGYALAMSGRRAEAEDIARELEERARSEWVNSSRIAMVYGALGDSDLAFQWLDLAFEERDVLLLQIRDYPFFDPLRSDPRLGELLGRMGLRPKTIGPR